MLLGISRAPPVVWSGAIAKDSATDWSLRNLHKEITQLVEAGGGRELQDDNGAIRTIAEGKPRAVLVFVRAWEAPLLDLQDFLANLRAALGPACSIVVVPIGAAGTTADEPQRMTWARWVGRIGDPAIYMESGA